MIFLQMLHGMIPTKHSLSAIATAISSVAKVSCIMPFVYFKLVFQQGSTSMLVTDVVDIPYRRRQHHFKNLT